MLNVIFNYAYMCSFIRLFAIFFYHHLFIITFMIIILHFDYILELAIAIIINFTIRFINFYYQYFNFVTKYLIIF